MSVRVRVHRAVWQRGFREAVLFGRTATRDVYVIVDVLEAIDVQNRLDAGRSEIVVVVSDHKVALLPREEARPHDVSRP